MLLEFEVIVKFVILFQQQKISLSFDIKVWYLRIDCLFDHKIKTISYLYF